MQTLAKLWRCMMDIIIKQGITKPHIRTLPICETPPVQMYLHHTLPLSMVLVHDIRYMYKHYTQVYFDPAWEEQAGFLFDFDIPFINQTVLLTQKFHKKTIAIPSDQIIEQMIHWMDNEYYILFYA